MLLCQVYYVRLKKNIVDKLPTKLKTCKYSTLCSVFLSFDNLAYII